MWPAALTRLLKRRLVYIMLVTLPLAYYFIRLFKQQHHLNMLDSESSIQMRRDKPLIWRNLQQHLLTDNDLNNRTNPTNISCRNTVQGRDLLTDDRGFVCPRQHILQNGCCDIEKSNTLYYTCLTCDTETQCCHIYEYCVSCCLHPGKRMILESALALIKGKQRIIYAQVMDQFELCLMKCRTNSHSVEHENRYRYGQILFCYGHTEAHISQLDVGNR